MPRRRGAPGRVSASTAGALDGHSTVQESDGPPIQARDHMKHLTSLYKNAAPDAVSNASGEAAALEDLTDALARAHATKIEGLLLVVWKKTVGGTKKSRSDNLANQLTKWPSDLGRSLDKYIQPMLHAAVQEALLPAEAAARPEPSAAAARPKPKH